MQDWPMSTFVIYFNFMKLAKMEWENNGKDEKQGKNGLINLVRQSNTLTTKLQLLNETWKKCLTSNLII